MINVDNINWSVKADVEGKLISKSSSKYLMDFRQGLKKYPLTVNPDSYENVLIDKKECVKK
jgi:hypothetical protein